MTTVELASNDGREGRPAYVAVNGTIYDVSSSPLWANGAHPPDHRAGMDLTEELTKAPHVRAVLERFPVVGKLEADAVTHPSTGGGKTTFGIIIGALIVALALFLLL